MSQNIFRIPVRFNLNNPEHSRIVAVLQGLHETRNITKSSFIIEALSYYIAFLSSNSSEGRDLLPGMGDGLVTKKDLETRLSVFQKEVRLYMLETILPVITSGQGVGSSFDDENAEKGSKQPSGPIDISNDPDIMESVNSWLNITE